MAPSLRSKARRLALQALYEWDTAGHDPQQALAHLRQADSEQTPEEAALAYAQELVERTCAEHERLDRLIQAHAPAWPVDQLPAVDRNILRLALTEILGELTPPKAAINEAVELAKTYGDENTPRFVNGALGSALAELQPGHYPKRAPQQKR